MTTAASNSDDQPFTMKEKKLCGTGIDHSEGSENEAAEANKKTFKYSWVLNKLNADIAMWQFETSRCYCTIIDAPGHRDFVKNMIVATSQADFAVLVIDSTVGGFEAGISKGGQTREHALLAYALGVKQMICCCNKMDATTLLYSEARYDEIKKEVSSCLMEVGYDPNEIPFVPIYGLEGDNVIESSTRLSWYRGPTLYQALELLIELKCPSDELNCHPLQEVYKTRSVRTVPVGGVKTRVRKPGMVVTFGSSSLETRVKSNNPLFDTEEKVHINIIVIGHVNSGKSTTTGHLVHRLGRISNHYLQRLKNEATEGNKKSSKYAWMLDKIKAEHERGFTIDISLWKFETLKYYCTVFDAPGHRHLITNMIIGTGTFQVDCAILVIDSISGVFEFGISEEGQTLGYALLAHTLGVKEMICCCNKMDATTPNYSKARYLKIRKAVSSYLKKVGYEAGRIPFIPISALEGDYMIQRSARLSWYKGPTLYEALDHIDEPKRPVDTHRGLPLQDLYKIQNIGTVPEERVENSTLNSGMVFTCGLSGPATEVKSLEMDLDSLLEAGMTLL
ncbi:hypothetical protein AgCh_033712 [Apium graveolens]